MLAVSARHEDEQRHGKIHLGKSKRTRIALHHSKVAVVHETRNWVVNTVCFLYFILFSLSYLNPPDLHHPFLSKANLAYYLPGYSVHTNGRVWSLLPRTSNNYLYPKH